MDNLEAKRIVNLYNKKNNLWLRIELIFFILVLFSPINFFLKLFISVIGFLITMTISTTYFKRKYVGSIINDRLDPELFYAVLCAAKLNNRYAIDDILAAYCLNDYDSVYNICTQKLNDKKCKNFKYQYYTFLARIYFDTGDFEKLQAICDDFDKALLTEKKSKQIREMYTFVEFCKQYLAERFDVCKFLYETRLQDKKATATKQGKVSAKYSYAIACYKTGDLEKAKENFEYVVAEAPKLNLSVYAQKYLDALDGGRQYSPEHREIKEVENFTLPEPLKSPETKKGLIIFTICILGLLGIAIFVSIANNSNKTLFVSGKLLFDCGASSLEEVESCSFIHATKGDWVEIYDSEFIERLAHYTYAEDYPADQIHNLFAWPQTQQIKIIINGETYILYLSEDGSISTSIVQGESFKTYRTDEKHQITTEEINSLNFIYQYLNGTE